MARTSQKLVEVISTKRSGHHAFIEALCRNWDRPIVFCNNLQGQGCLSNHGVLYEPREPPVLLWKGDSRHVNLAERPDCDYVVNYEGVFPSNLKRMSSIIQQTSASVDTQAILFLRDPLNTFASRARQIETTKDAHPNKWRFICRQYVASVLMFEEMMTTFSADQFQCLVLYNSWISNESYRDGISRTVGFDIGCDAETVSPYGKGSSFDGLGLDLGSKTGLLSRWQGMRNNALFLSLFVSERFINAVGCYYDKFSGAFDPKRGLVDELQRVAESDPLAMRFYEEHYQRWCRRIGILELSQRWAGTRREKIMRYLRIS